MALKLSAANRKDIRQPTNAHFQHAHYAEVARIIRELATIMGPMHQQAAAKHFADQLEGTNPKFDRTRFLVACIPLGKGSNP